MIETEKEEKTTNDRAKELADLRERFNKVSDEIKARLDEAEKINAAVEKFIKAGKDTLEQGKIVTEVQKIAKDGVKPEKKESEKVKELKKILK